jgi:hypothetical protein
MVLCSAKRDDSLRNIPAHVYKTDYYPNSVSSTTESNRASSSQNRDEMTNMIAEFNDLLRQLPPNHSSQNSDMNYITLLLLLTASSNSRSVQNNNMSNRNGLPIGYRVQSCNTCIPGNHLDPISNSSIELEALTKINYRCQHETLLSSINPQQQNTYDIQNVIRQIQAGLISYLVQVVNIRISMQQAMEAGRQIAGPDAWLRAQELYTPKLMLEIMAGKKLPDDRSWLKEEEYIDLDHIGANYNRGNNNNKEQQKPWAYRLIKQEGAVKTLKINSNELMNFLNITKSTFGTFQVQVDDNQSKRYFVISIAFKP